MIFHIDTRKFWGLLLTFGYLFGSLASVPASASKASEDLIIPTIKRDTLLNGLQLLTLEKAGSGSLSLKVRVNSGAMFDLAGKGGLADLTAGMLLRGGGGYSASAIEETVKQYGLRINISVNWDATEIEFSGPADAADEMFDLLGRLMITPTFDQKEFEALKSARLTAIKTATDEAELLTRKAMETIYSAHPYGKPIIGTSESVQQITKFDLSYYHKKFYLANNAILMAVGEISAEEVTKLARAKLGGWKKGEKAPPSFRPPSPLSSRKVMVQDKPESQNAHAIIAQTGFSRRSPDYLAALVMSVIVRKQIEKRLGQVGEIRFEPRTLNGPIIVKLKSPASDLANQLNGALLAFSQLQTNESSLAEVESAKAQVITGMKDLLRDNPAQILFDIELYGLGKDYLVTFAERVNAITPVDIQKVAQAYLKPQAILIAAPAKVYENEWKKLGDVIVTP